MIHTSQDISPLRQRMIDDMRMRKLAPKTQAGYVRVVRQFAAFLGRPPDTATVEDLRRYQLHLVDHGISPVSLNAAITGLKFFFEITLNQPELMARMQPVRVPRTLPVVLSPDEVARLIAAAGNLKHQTALSVAYGAGLRASEVVALKVGDVDSHRMTLRIEQGKGRRDRYAMLSPVLLERLRVWWRVAHAQGHALAVDVADLERHHFAGAQAGAVGDRQRRLVLQVAGGGDQAGHFVRAEHDGQRVRHPYRLHPGHQFRSLKGDPEEELQCGNRGIQRHRGNAVVDQM